MKYCKLERTHSGRYFYGKIPMETFKEPIILASQNFTNIPEYAKLRETILDNILDSFEQNPTMNAEFLFLNPYSPAMELRIRDREADAAQVQDHLLSMYSYLHYIKSHPTGLASRISIKVYDQIPPFALFQLDNNLYVFFFQKGFPSTTQIGLM